jgi:SPP1 family predicted phage head-tail adaptor
MAALNDYIVIQKFTYTANSQGTVEETWATHQACWADIEQISGSEGFRSDMDVYNDVKSFVIHYEEGKTVTPRMRISFSGYYYITSVSHKDKLKTTLIAIRNDDE